MKFTKQYFINKFTDIPSEDIGSSLLENHCALHHCGVVSYEEPTDESLALSELLRPVYIDAAICSPEEARKRHAMAVVWEINDNAVNLGRTPKERILKALSLATD